MVLLVRPSVVSQIHKRALMLEDQPATQRISSNLHAMLALEESTFEMENEAGR